MTGPAGFIPPYPPRPVDRLPMFETMRRFRRSTTETAGFYNTVGFNDDTRAFCSIPARHDVARRVDCAYLANLVATHRLREDEAYELAQLLAYGLAKSVYRL
jgi:glucuronate isomerase